MRIEHKIFTVLALVITAAGCTPTRSVSDSESAQGAAQVGAPVDTRTGTPRIGEYGAGEYGASGSGVYPPDSGGRAGGQAGPGTVGRVVYFDFDSSEVRPESRPVIEANAHYLMEHSTVATVLEGHTDERGTREYNIALGERRAEAVRRLMNAYGVPSQQARTMSYGEERPAVAGHDEASYAQNRRVEITY